MYIVHVNERGAAPKEMRKMKATAFYIKGTDKKVRTSKTHNYTHYICGQCCSSYELAVKARDRTVSIRFPRETAEDVISSGYYKVCAKKAEEARYLLDKHDEDLVQEKGRKLVNLGYIRGIPFFGAKATEKELENARQKIADREAFRARLEIFELEARP